MRFNEIEFPIVKIGDIAQVINGRAYKSNELLASGKYRVLRVGNFFSSDNWYYSDMELPEDKYCDYGDLLFAWSASFGPKIWSYEKVIYHYHIWKIVPNNNVDKKFLYYWLKFSTNSLLSNVHGSVMGHLTKSFFENVSLRLPPIEIQQKISKILSSLDDKIDINNKINKNIEEIAQTIFKSWFIDFEPFRSGEFVESEQGMIPNGWIVGKIGDYCKIKSGFAFKSSWWQDTGIPVIKIKNIENGEINFDQVSYVSEEKSELANEFKVFGGEILIAMTGATIGKFAIVPKLDTYALVNQRVGKFFFSEDPVKKLPFLFCLLSKKEVKDEIVSKGDGSAQPNISPSSIESIKVIIPEESILEEFNKTMEGWFRLILTNDQMNSSITAIRDELLFKLMSGEIRFPLEGD